MRSVKQAAARLSVVALILTGCGGGGTALPKVAPGTEVTAGVDIKSDSFSFPNFGSSGSPEVFGSADVVSMFGDSSEVCATGTGSTCTLTAEAATWARMVNQARESGHCEGFAVMSAARFMQSATPKTDTLSNQGDVTHGIMRGFATQFEHSVQDETNKWAKKSVGEKVVAIGEALKQGKVEYVLGVYSQEGGHAVLPWKLEYVDESTVRIHVYDSNWPGIDRYVTADLKGNSWTFSFSGRDQANDPKIWNGGASDMDLASMTARQDGTCPFCKGGARVKNSMFVIRAATLDWSVVSAAGSLSPKQNLIGDDSARPLKAADSASRANEDYLINATIPDTKPITFDLPSETHITGVTPGGAVEVQTSGSQSSVAVSETSVSSPDPSTVLTLAAGNFVATANGSNTEIKATDAGLTVRTETSTGQVVTATVTAEAPAVEVRTGSAANVADGGYQVITQTGANEITTKTVTETGKVTETVSSGTIAATSTNVVIPPTLSAPPVDAALPSIEERLQPVVTTTTTVASTTTVPVTTTTIAKTTATTTPKATTTTVPTTTTSTTTTTTTTTPKATTTTVPTTTTTAAATTTTTTIPALPSTPWMQHLSATSKEQHQQIVTDASGNVYSTGSFCGSSMTVGSVTLTNINSSGGTLCDVYVEKISTTGTVVWAKRFGGSGQDSPNSIAVDGSGNVYVVATYDAAFTFGSTTVALSNGFGSETAYVKYDSAGVPQWAWEVSSMSVYFMKVAAFGSNVYLSSTLTSAGGSVSIGGVSITVPPSTLGAGVVARINPADGVPAWTDLATTTSGSLYMADVAVDGSGSAYVTGSFNGSSMSIGSSVLANAGTYTDDGFLAKWGPSGTLVYARSFGGPGIDLPKYVAVDSSKRAFVLYTTEGSAVYYGSSLAASATATLNRFGVIQIALDGQSLVSTKVYGASSATSILLGGLAVDPAGSRAYVAGYYIGGSIDLDGTVLADPVSNKDVFYVGYGTGDGVMTIHGRIGESGDEYMQGGGGLAVDYSGNPYLAFDSGSPSLTSGATTYVNQGIDAYLVKSNPAGQWP